MACCDADNKFPDKSYLEDVVLEFDFSPSMEPTESILQVKDVVVEMLAGVGPDPDTIRDGAAAIAAQVVRVPIHNGVRYATYNFTVVVDTSLRDNLVLSGFITIV